MWARTSKRVRECVYVRDAWQGVNGWILRDWVCTRVTVCEYEWILKHYPRMNVARIKACNRVTIRWVSFILAATQWYHFSRVVIFPFACVPFRVGRGAAAFELEERERKSNGQVYKKNYYLTDNSLFLAIRRKHELEDENNYRSLAAVNLTCYLQLVCTIIQ